MQIKGQPLFYFCGIKRQVAVLKIKYYKCIILALATLNKSKMDQNETEILRKTPYYTRPHQPQTTIRNSRWAAARTRNVNVVHSRGHHDAGLLYNSTSWSSNTMLHGVG